ncbi:transketolase [Pseudonocardia sp. C8]|uniref:transketolase n=1 Tax=Pseudonocardia sp. C8 TaxID=2762759 RepID=UPI0016426B30|nr:transketolase [Pseudonocardia sp. C8]MBC3193661.1 transketolase [Pseudonocardia sp. C8]
MTSRIETTAPSPELDGGPPQPSGVDDLVVETIRFLSADAVQAANSGHPGLPLGAAPTAWTLWSRHLRHDPTWSEWPDRDRFVLSAGHGSALLYSLLHLTGYDLPLDELRNFRRLGSRTPGHPEYGLTTGVETTTGPLGQGLANAVGMALAERMLAARCNTDGHQVVGHRTWALVGDGCLMEGISHEAASLAGRLGLGKLTVLFDDNDVTIDGPASASCHDDAEARFRSYGWHTLRVADGTDLEAIDQALTEATLEEGRPTFIAIRTTIGHGAPGIEGTSKAHGSPLGEAALTEMRHRAGWPDTAFHIPDAVGEETARLRERWTAEREEWERTHAEWRSAHPGTAADFPLDRVPPPPDLTVLADRPEQDGPVATRKAGAAVLRALAEVYPALVGGSADLASSTGTTLPGGEAVPGHYAGRNIPFGVREHAMAAVLNGLALHGGLRPFGSTFLVFSDYLRPALRLSALMGLPVVHVFTHDSVHVGEDGPTHQPVEHIESLRLIPGLTVLRPADAAESELAWELAAADLSGPTALILSRQDLPGLGRAGLEDVRERGARTVADPPGAVEVVLAASGSEVATATAAAELLAARDVGARVVSVPWRERFADALRAGNAGLPDVPVVWVEAGVPTGWRAVAAPRDVVVGLERFGESGKGAAVAEHVGMSATAVARAAWQALDREPAAFDEVG